MEIRRRERIQKLALALQSVDKLHLKEAARLLEVSEMTIRRDLSEPSLEVDLIGGYIVTTRQSQPYFVCDQQKQNAERKQKLALAGAALINPGDTVFFDCGTTLPYLIDALPATLAFTAVCCAMNTFLALKEKPALRVILSGGEYHSDNALFTPVSAHTLLDDLCPTLAFISAAGVDAVQGATCYNLNELAMKHHAMRRAHQRILVADSSKFGKVLPARIGELSQFDGLLSDQPAPGLLGKQLAQANVIQHAPA